jgi:alpha-aminoadipate carrier protein LysW
VQRGRCIGDQTIHIHTRFQQEINHMSPNSVQSVVAASCPDCGGSIELSSQPIVGEILPCPECGAEFELRSVQPIALAAAPELEEDWGE